MLLPKNTLRATDANTADRQMDSRDHLSFQDLYREHEPAVRRWIQKCALREEEVDDLVHETFLKAWTHLSQFRGEAKLTTWLFRIATNEVRQLYRQQRTRNQRHRMLTGSLRQEEWLIDPNAFSLTTVMEADTGARLRAAIQNLPKPMRDAVMLRDLEEVPICQAAARLGLTIAALKTRHFRARRELKRHLGSLPMDWPTKRRRERMRS
ncbi:MAG: RNA polymerase sigma factor [Acidobacteriaceae bacterium]|nr:RNA polymerase sigma factor [Acidobacteriaceae bacterium]